MEKNDIQLREMSHFSRMCDGSWNELVRRVINHPPFGHTGVGVAAFLHPVFRLLDEGMNPGWLGTTQPKELIHILSQQRGVVGRVPSGKEVMPVSKPLQRLVFVCDCFAAL